MGRVISIHSFRGGTGKSNTTANTAYALARQGKRVAIVDTDIQSPGIHVLFGATNQIQHTLNDYLWGKAGMRDVALDVSANVGLEAGSLHLVASSMNMGDITRILKEGYDVGLLNRGLKELQQELGLDYVMIDTHPGLNEETLLSIAISDALLLILRPDQQDFQGTSVTVEVARRLRCQNLFLVVNKLPPKHDLEQVKAKVEDTYQAEVLAVLPLSEDIVELGSSNLCLRVAPENLWARGIEGIAARLLAL